MSKTLIPALQAKAGDLGYYICVMSYAQAAREISFAHELMANNRELNQLIQRAIGERTNDIKDYLLKSETRFLGALIVAAWGGHPTYQSVEMSSGESLLDGLDSKFGVLTFDGTQQYFALDGQHRLRAIKDAIKENPELGSEEVTIILVSHFDDERGRQKTRRLLTRMIHFP